MSDLAGQLQQSLGTAYRVERELGGGGMSRVFVAEELRFRRKVVIKVLSSTLAETVSAERFEREVMLAAQLQQANIVPVITAGDVDGVPYYTMPFVEGESLRTRLSRGAMPVSEAVAILRDVARALAYAHERGIVHRDIKPENVLLSGGAAVVTDFGIAKAISASRTQAPGGTLTVMGTSLGTPAYMAPEQAVGDPVDHRADIYASGVVAYEMLGGEHPFAGKTTSQQLIAAHIAEQPKPLGAIRKGIPAGLAALVMSSLDKSPDKRPQSAQTLLKAMEDQATVRADRESALAGWMAHWSARKAVGVAAGVVVLIAAAYGAANLNSLRGNDGADSTSAELAAATPGIRTIAVLPFVNTGGNAQDEYFSDGMTDELAHALSRLPDIRVAARTSTYAFKGKSASVQEIGRALNVAGVVEGTVRRAGDRLRVTAQLTSASDGLVVWSNTYETRATDVFQVQDEVTQSIVSAIAPTLAGGRATAMAQASRGTDDLEAYDLYLKGRYFFAQRGARSLGTAAENFRRAIAKDPDFARAHAGLAMVHAVLPGYVTVNADSVLRLAIQSGTRALELDSTLADAHLALGNAFTSRMNFTDSERHLRRAIALEPENATGYFWYAIHLQSRGQIEEALAQLRRATELDPLSVVIGGNLALGLYLARRFPEAIAQANRMLELDSLNWGASYWILGFSHAFNNSPDSSLRALQASYRMQPDLPASLSNVLFGHAVAGQWSEAKRLKAQIEGASSGAATRFNMLFARLAFDDRAGAISSLEDIYRRNESISIINSLCDPIFDRLRNEPRFIRLKQQFGVQACPAATPWPIKLPPP